MNEKIRQAESREREAEERGQRARQSQQQLEQLNARRAEDWQVWFRQSLFSELTRPGDNPIRDGLGEVIATERAARRKEVNDAVEEAKRAFEAKLEALEQRQRQAQQEQATNNQAALEKWFRDSFYGEVIATERATRRKEVEHTVEELHRVYDAKLEALERRLKSTPGKLPVAKVWRFFSHEGGLWQAKRDTARTPGASDDWVPVARAGRDALTPVVRGTFAVDVKYKQLDVVVSDGASFIAKRDNPGLCPGDGW